MCTCCGCTKCECCCCTFLFAYYSSVLAFFAKTYYDEQQLI